VPFVGTPFFVLWMGIHDKRTMRVLMPLPEADTTAKIHLLVNEPIAHSEANECHNADTNKNDGRDRRGVLL